MPVADDAEVQRVDLAGAVLELASWGEASAAEFPWYERPTESALAAAEKQLRALGAIDDERKITNLGRRMAALPLQPRLARLVVAGQETGHPADAALLAAYLSERDPLRTGRGAEAEHRSDSDVVDRLSAIQDFERNGRAKTWLGELDTRAAKAILRIRDQFLKQLRDDVDQNTSEADDRAADEATMWAVFTAFPDRLARRREPGGLRAVMVGGRGVKLAQERRARRRAVRLRRPARDRRDRSVG
ncbi:MAG: hypothetical protein QM811_15230 [Pirellulales bacterium]